MIFKPIMLLAYMHNVKSDLIWRKYSPWWLYKAIAIKWGDLGRAGNFGRCLLGTYWGTPDRWHTLTQTNTNTFQYWALLAVKWWPLLPKYGHKSNKINGIELFSLQSLYIYSQEPKKALNLPKFWPPIFPANRAKFYIVHFAKEHFLFNLLVAKPKVAIHVPTLKMIGATSTW